MSIGAQLVIIGLGILLVAFFSAAETAMMSINRSRLNALVEAGDARAALIQKMMEQHQRFPATVLLGNTIGIISASAVATLLADRHFGGPTSVGIVILLMALLVLICGEILPKSLSGQYGETVALLLARPLHFISLALSPILSLIIWLTGPVMRAMGANGRLRPRYTMAELRNLVELGTEEGELEKPESKLIQSAFAFDETHVNQIITPRVDIVALPVHNTVKEALETMIEEGFSRLPVFQDNIDNILGAVNFKDLLKVHYEFTRARKDPSGLPILHYIRPVYHVPENKKVDELMREMQCQRIQMAVVSDEYGGTVGLVTMEDLMEEIVGEIRDEHDIDELPIYHIIDENTVSVDGKMGIDEVNELLNTNLQREDYETVGGLIFNTLGRVPQVGDSVLIEYLKLTVERIDGIRIVKVKIEKLRAPTTKLQPLEEVVGDQGPGGREQ